MHDALDSLTDKEKETLRLMVRGHDAKSAARELDLSVHTINDRLRVARRKLEVTSSREAARLLHERERETPDILADKDLGAAEGEGHGQSARDRHIPAWVIGAIAMPTVLAIALALATQQSGTADEPLAVDVENVERAAEIQAAARDFLAMVDARDWEGSFAATSKVFRAANTVDGWSDASKMVFGRLGTLEERGEATIRFVNAPPAGYQEVSFASRYSKGGEVTEVITLVKEDGTWKVVGIMVD